MNKQRYHTWKMEISVNWRKKSLLGLGKISETLPFDEALKETLASLILELWEETVQNLLL